MLMLAGLAGLAPAARAQDADIPATLALFASSNFDDVQKGIEQIAASGHPSAIDILQALGDGRLFAAPDGSIAYKDAAGSVHAALTGEILAEVPAGAKAVRANNRIRRAVEAALGQLTLMSPDPAKRLEAALSVLKSKDQAVLPLVDAALAKETEPGVKAALEQAKAVLVLYGPGDDAAKIAAVATVAARGNQEALALLAAVPAPSPALAEVLAAATTAIESRLAWWSAVQSVYYGVSLGSVLLLAAIGLAITFGVMGVINMAHGEMVMIGAYTTFVVQDIIRNSAPWLFDYSLAIALPLAFLVAGAVGIAIERGIIRFLYGRPLETLLATFGLSLVLQQAVRTLFGPTNREVGNPSWMSGAFDLGGLTLTYNRMWIIVFSLVVLFVLMIVLRRTAFGLQMRAVTQNRRMAGSMGIRTNWVDSLTFGLGSGVAGIAGVALSQIDNVSPNLGQGYIIDSFMVVVFGGVGNLWGTLVGAMTLGITNKLLEPMAGAVLGKILVLVALVLFIQRKPRGLFPQKGRAVER
ncbi:urea ABC transporter permease subunit UrtB [Zavarzinia compransoris]|uniref:Urea ABC transporter permease subunit UrtB n=2 Tax=Zavarzinia compransoris TaxID=1264899 RepID=A0A317E6M4_9PROT|nr:urea ABC transporter permease subunit UrtB [Zavarzinia compransoris]